MWWILTFFVIVSPHLFLARLHVEVCKSNNDCIQGYYCQDNICLKCVQCSLILRKGNDCVVDFNSCGECLTGYEEVLVTDSSNAIKPCKPVKWRKEKMSKKKCTNDSACPPNNYCHEHSCVECFNCELLHRLIPQGRCAKELTECGSCKEGFIEVAVTTDYNFKPCESSRATRRPSSVHNLICYSLITLICIVFLLLMILEFKGNQKPYKVLKKCLQPVLPSAPPLPTPDASEQIAKVEEKHAHAMVDLEKIQQAKVFKLPDASYYKTDIGDRGSNLNLESNAQDSRNYCEQSESEVIRPAGVFVHNYIELSQETSETESVQQQPELRLLPTAGDEDQEQSDIPEEDLGSASPDINNSDEGKL